MIHSRPGYMPRKNDQQVAKLQPDMIPAINRAPGDDATAMPNLEEKLAARTAGKTFTPPADVLKAAQAAEIIPNPSPSAPPRVLAPGK